MKHYTHIILVCALCLVAVYFSSCQVDKKDYTSFVKDAAGYHVISDGDVDLDKQYSVWADQLGNEPSDVDPSDPDGYNQVEGKSTFMQMFSPLMNMATNVNVHQIVGTYQSEYKGKPIILSGNMYVPKSKNSASPTRWYIHIWTNRPRDVPLPISEDWHDLSLRPTATPLRPMKCTSSVTHKAVTQLWPRRSLSNRIRSI